MPFYDAGDAAISYDIEGTGRPVILMHGYALNSLMWSFQVPELAKHFQTYAIDLRGFGKSSCSDTWSGQAMADDIAGLITSLDLHDCTVIGFSLSGPVAFRLAVEQADRVSSLVMVSSILPSAGKPQPESRQKTKQKELDLLTAAGVEGWAEKAGLRQGPLVDNMFVRNPAIEPVWERLIKRHNPDYLKCMMRARMTTPSPVDWRSRLPEAAQPTLIIAGAQDSRFIDASRYINRQIKGSRLEIISNAGHMVNLEQPEQFNKVLIEFLKSV